MDEVLFELEVGTIGGVASCHKPKWYGLLFLEVIRDFTTPIVL